MNREPPVEFGHFLLPFLLWAFLRLTRGTRGVQRGSPISSLVKITGMALPRVSKFLIALPKGLPEASLWPVNKKLAKEPSAQHRTAQQKREDCCPPTPAPQREGPHLP